ncbi:MAG: glutathione S-transferase family protein [Rhodospirillaceae bacterium]
MSLTLIISPTSPYARMCWLVALDGGLGDSLTIQKENPWDPETPLKGINPLSKVPALVLDGGQVLVDSPLICDYLDRQRVQGSPLIPLDGPARWDVLARATLARGALDAAIACRIETVLRPEDKQHQPWLDRQWGIVTNALKTLEPHYLPVLDGPTDFSHIALACSFGFLEFRYPEHSWRADHPQLAAWYDSFKTTPHMVETVPVG